MPTRRTGETVVAAPVEACLGVILDVAAYPDWVRGYRAAAVEAVDERGRPEIAAYEVGGFGMRARFRLSYDYGDDPVHVAFAQVDGDLTRTVEGRYELAPVGSSTRVTYTASVEMAVPVPRVARSAAERIVMDAALRSLRFEVMRRRAM